MTPGTTQHEHGGCPDWQAEVDAYVASDGVLCPFCGSDEIQGGFISVEGDRAVQPCDCPRCMARWTSIYRLVGIETDSHGEIIATPGERRSDRASRE